MYSWKQFYLATKQPSLYILGAGASMPTIGNNFISTITKFIIELGSCKAYPQERSIFEEKVQPLNSKYDEEAFINNCISINERISHTPPHIIKILYEQAITLSNSVLTEQYAVFDLFYSSFIFNFNNDNLSFRIHQRHYQTYPHGRVNADFVHSLKVKKAMQFLINITNKENSFPYHPPISEPQDITSTEPYIQLKKIFSRLKTVIIIGYSFGKQKDNSLDDLESFEMIVDLLKWNPKPVIIIDPFPENLFNRIEIALQRKCVYRLACKWNILAKFIFSRQLPYTQKVNVFTSAEIMTLLYQKFEEDVN